MTRIDATDATQSTSDNLASSGQVVVVWDSTHYFAGIDPAVIQGLVAEVDRWTVEYEPCKSEGSSGFNQPYQTRSRSGSDKRKVPWAKRIAKRRRRSKLAKQHKKAMKLAAKKKDDERCRTRTAQPTAASRTSSGGDSPPRNSACGTSKPSGSSRSCSRSRPRRSKRRRKGRRSRPTTS